MAGYEVEHLIAQRHLLGQRLAPFFAFGLMQNF